MFRRQLHLRLFGQAKKIGESDLVYVYLHKMVVVYQDVYPTKTFDNNICTGSYKLFTFGNTYKSDEFFLLLAKEYPSFVNLYALIVQLPGVNEHESEFLNFSPIYEHYYKVNNLDKLKWKCSTPHETLEEFLEYSLNTNYKIKTSVTSQK
nr:pre-mRNA-processing-splicing factor 8,putative [Plasmodium sp. DRC-Itaito]